MPAARIAGKKIANPLTPSSTVTIRQLIPDSTGKNINCLSAHKIAKLSCTRSQLRENLPIGTSLARTLSVVCRSTLRELPLSCQEYRRKTSWIAAHYVRWPFESPLRYNFFPHVVSLSIQPSLLCSIYGNSFPPAAALGIPQRCGRRRSPFGRSCCHRALLLPPQDPRSHSDLLRPVLRSLRCPAALNFAVVPLAFRSATRLLDLPELGRYLHHPDSFRPFLLPGQRRILQEVPSLAGCGADAVRCFRNLRRRARYEPGDAQCCQQHLGVHFVHRHHPVHLRRS